MPALTACGEQGSVGTRSLAIEEGGAECGEPVAPDPELIRLTIATPADDSGNMEVSARDPLALRVEVSDAGRLRINVAIWSARQHRRWQFERDVEAGFADDVEVPFHEIGVTEQSFDYSGGVRIQAILFGSTRGRSFYRTELGFHPNPAGGWLIYPDSDRRALTERAREALALRVERAANGGPPAELPTSTGWEGPRRHHEDVAEELDAGEVDDEE